MHFIVMCDDNYSVDVSKSMMYGEDARAAVALFSKVRGVKS